MKNEQELYSDITFTKQTSTSPIRHKIKSPTSRCLNESCTQKSSMRRRTHENEESNSQRNELSKLNNKTKLSKTTVKCNIDGRILSENCRKSIFHSTKSIIVRLILTVFIFHLLLTNAHAAGNGLSRREVNKEILSLFGFSRTPQPSGYPARERQNDAAPLYMLGLYNTVSGFAELFDNRIKEGQENPNAPQKREAPSSLRQNPYKGDMSSASYHRHSSGPFSHTYPFDVRIATNSAWYRYSEAQMVFQNEIGIPERDQYKDDQGQNEYQSMMNEGLEQNLLREADVVMSINATNRAYHEDDRASGTLLKRHRPFYFNVSQIPKEDSLISAKFRLYKNMPQESLENTTLRVNVYRAMFDKNKKTELHLIESRRVRSDQEGWLVFDITSACKDWMTIPNNNLGLRVAVETLKGRSQNLKKAGIVGKRRDPSKQAFLVSFLSQGTERLPRQARERMRRNVADEDADFDDGMEEEDEDEEEGDNEFDEENSSENSMEDNREFDNRPTQKSRGRSRKGKNSNRGSKRKERNQVQHNKKPDEPACHREELYVNFRDLNWDGWIIAPAGYLAYHCMGACHFPMNDKMNATNHAIVQTLVHLLNRDRLPNPCCSPTELTAISVLYYDDNNNVVFKKYKNMVVQACGCK